jgi:pimeloyl-ACP methyl ester carboxylesterase
VKLIDLKQITVPTLIICGSKDPYLNYDLIDTALEDLPKGSELEVIEGGSHAVLVEKPYYHDFQERLIRYLD